MSCKSVEKLLPLYVEGDLTRRPTETVRGHLEGCAACRTLLEGYRASQRALHDCAGPEVGGAVLDDMRKAVWRRIDSQPSRAALWLQIERIWAALRHWAAQPAVALATVSVVMLGSFGVSRLQSEAPMVVTSVAESVPGAEDPAVLAARLAELDDAVARIVSGTTIDEGSRNDQMRIEIQTGDPEVRIIWFSAKDEAAPVEN